jgi:hypothetical protein
VTPAWLGRLLLALRTRRCTGCGEPAPHTHHLTWLGRRRYTRNRVPAWVRRALHRA